ncbi:hypothetical protein ALC53_05486 [Atta colombica]|uniref:C2H2-type domain-containing protein n=1 Tax=Atta colombica TaxID=520822 RepID=A0A195BH61_9HYME|nr:hypothetical protein ALC53_05486 [Atta colombica]
MCGKGEAKKNEEKRRRSRELEKQEQEERKEREAPKLFGVKTDVWYKLVIPCFAFPFMGEVARGRSEFVVAAVYWCLNSHWSIVLFCALPVLRFWFATLWWYSLGRLSTQHAALIGGPNATSCPVCHKLFLGGEALMEHMKHTHKDPNASGVANTRCFEGVSFDLYACLDTCVRDTYADWRTYRENKSQPTLLLRSTLKRGIGVLFLIVSADTVVCHSDRHSRHLKCES